MIDETGEPILADFGKAKKIESEADFFTNSIEGTLLFLPPECHSFD